MQHKMMGNSSILSFLISSFLMRSLRLLYKKDNVRDSVHYFIICFRLLHNVCQCLRVRECARVFAYGCMVLSCGWVDWYVAEGV